MKIITSTAFLIALVGVVVVFPSMSTAQQQETTPVVVTLNATRFQQMMNDPVIKWFDVIVDVRTRSEYITGHISGSTLVESLASFGTSSQISTPEDLRGCEYCNIVVYCRSGSRAAAALQHLITAGYRGNLYNGLGVSQWTDAGYPLFIDENSVIPPCTINTTISTQCEISYRNRTGTSSTSTTNTPVMAPVGTTPTTGAVPTTMTSNGPPLSRIIKMWKSILQTLRSLFNFF